MAKQLLQPVANALPLSFRQTSFEDDFVVEFPVNLEISLQTNDDVNEEAEDADAAEGGEPNPERENLLSFIDIYGCD